MFLGNARIDESVGVELGEFGQPRPILHRRRDGHDIVIVCSFRNEGFRENRRIRRSFARLLLNLAGREDVYKRQISYRDGSFFLVMGQGDTGTMKATFTTTDLVGPWQILEITEETIHNVG